jgi:hypothetical protein
MFIERSTQRGGAPETLNIHVSDVATADELTDALAAVDLAPRRTTATVLAIGLPRGQEQEIFVELCFFLRAWQRGFGDVSIAQTA